MPSIVWARSSACRPARRVDAPARLACERTHAVAPWLIALTGVIYLWVAGDLWWHGKTGLALAYLGYSAANYGLWMAAKG